jgi:hypothetical protein
MYAIDAKLHAGVQTGIFGLLDGFGDNYAIPVNLGAMYMVDEKLSVGGTFGFHNLAGNNGDADGRGISIVGSYNI